MNPKGGLQAVPDLHLAIRKGFFQDIRYLVSAGEDVDIKDPADHRTPLMLCAMIEQEAWGVGIARLLLERGAMVGYADRRGQNALMYACVFGRVELTKVFLKAVDYDPNQRDRWGNTALFYAASNGNIEVVQAMIDCLLHFRLPLEKANKWGMTPLLEACRCGHFAVAEMLEKHGAPTDARDNILHWGTAEWKHDYEQRMIDEAPKSRSYEKPWLRRREPTSRNVKRSNSITSRDSSEGLPSISKGRSNTSSECDDEVFLPTQIIVTRTKSEPAITDQVRSDSRTLKKKLTSTSTKCRMLLKPWILDLTKGKTITAVFLPAPATSICPSIATSPTVSSTNSLIKQRAANSHDGQPQWDANHQYQHNFKQIFQRYEIQSSGSFRRRAKTPEGMKVPEIQGDVEQLSLRLSQTSRLTRKQSRMDMTTNNRLPSTGSSLEMNSSRKFKTGDARNRGGSERSKLDDSTSSVSSEDSAAARLMNAYRRRKTSTAQPPSSDK
ncbi:uncharacterized protein [Diadema antillarum]|uniref:uncharacterized protein n=1 Tax=Diadema antillarum TaxID=105358 RepID=UPI003A887718